MLKLYRCTKCGKLSEKWLLISTHNHCPDCGNKINLERDFVENKNKLEEN